MRLFFICLILAIPLNLLANNLRIDFAGIQSSDHEKAIILLDISWENSWKDSENHDGAWIFLKFKKDGIWRHATIEPSTGNSSQVNIIQVPDKKGIFITRSGSGEGAFSAAGIRIQWLYNEDGAAPDEMVDLKIFAMEMVLVPEGAFYLNGSASSSLENEFVSVDNSITYITGEQALSAASIRWIADNPNGGMGNLIEIGGIEYYGSDSLGPDYPKGYAAFYIQKYETTQQQYTDFLNSLPRTAQNNRVNKDITSSNITDTLVMTNYESARSRIWCASGINDPELPLVFHTDRPDRACNFITWSHAAAYLDWAGLRPMSELEYEKACRGPLSVVTNEFAWGSNNIQAAVTVSGQEDGTETITDIGANCNFNFIVDNIYFTGGDEEFGPLRSGIFATATSGREESGASYYGVMEMSGNVWERCVTIAEMDESGIPLHAGKFNRFIHGDGELDENGNANESFWPDNDGIGSNFRGGNWYRYPEWAMVSHRLYAGLTDNNVTSHRGIRGVRTVAWAESAGAGISQTRYKGGSYDGYDSREISIVLVSSQKGKILPQVKVYPNPARENIFIDSDPDVEMVEIFEISGKMVKSSRTASVNVSDLESGFYYLLIYAGENVSRVKLIRE